MTSLERELTTRRREMLRYARTPKQEVRNLADRSARGGALTRSRPKTRSRREPDREPEGEREARRAAEAIMNAGRRGSRRGLDVGPEAERAAEFIMSADDPDEENVDEAVELIKNAGPKRDARKDEGAEEE